MTQAYLISVREQSEQEGLAQLDAAIAELARLGVFPQRRDRAGDNVRWISVALDECQAESVRLRYPALLVGVDSNLSFSHRCTHRLRGTCR